MRRTIVSINQELCNGCGACASACHENAIEMGSDGKAHLTSDHYCDGMGDCLPACPTGAITITVREAEAYDEEAVKAHKRQMVPATSELTQWPVQIKLMQPNNPVLQGADLLVAATCTPFAYPTFHQDFIKGHAVLVGCPKLDDEDYSLKLGAILKANDIRSISLVRMEVPCCGGMTYFLQKAIALSGKPLSLRVITISTEGKVLSDEQ